jgi:hypothetical protein
MAPPEERARPIGDLYADPSSRPFAELVTHLEEDRQLALDFAQALKDRRRLEP